MPPDVDSSTGVLLSACVVLRTTKFMQMWCCESTRATAEQPTHRRCKRLHNPHTVMHLCLNNHLRKLILTGIVPAPQDVKPLIPIPQSSQCVSDTLIVSYYTLHEQFAECRTLQLTHIPKEKLTMATLEEFFSRYGSVRSVTLRYNNRDDCALVSFVDAATTEVAMKSSQAILDNRFVRVRSFVSLSLSWMLRFPLPYADVGVRS